MSPADNHPTSANPAYPIAKNCLLPNETVIAAMEIHNGFLILSDRRLVQVTASGEQSYIISRVVPHDCVVGIDRKKDSEIDLLARPLDKFGNFESNNETKIPLKAPRQDGTRSKEETCRQFQSDIGNISDTLIEIRSIEKARVTPVERYYSYLDNLPDSLTRDAILDLNAILQDKPYPDELYHEAAKFLGSNPFLLEESLRDSDNTDNGVLFAAGEKGCIWIRGIKRGRFMRNVLVETIEWENIRCIAYQWQHPDNRMNFIYVLQKQGDDKHLSVSWHPSIYEDVMAYPWLIQSANGPWIIADLMNRYSGLSLPALRHIKDQSQHGRHTFYL